MGVLKSFSIEDAPCASVQCEIALQLSNLRAYFYKFNRGNADEAMQRTFLHAYNNYTPYKGDLVPYLKALARTIMLIAEKHVPSDILEYIIEDGVDVGECVALGLSESNLVPKITYLALSHMGYFLQLCSLLKSNKLSFDSIYLPRDFKDSCIKLIRTYGVSKFNTAIMQVYDDCGDSMSLFINQGSNEPPVGVRRYCEADFRLISDRKSRRVKMECNKSSNVRLLGNTSGFDPDIEDWDLSGSVQGGAVYKIGYIDFINSLHNMASKDYITPL